MSDLLLQVLLSVFAFSVVAFLALLARASKGRKQPDYPHEYEGRDRL